MNLKFLFAVISLLVVLNHPSFSQDTNLVKYFPLKVGNAWYYRTTYTSLPPTPTVYHKEFIGKDTIIENRQYFKLQDRFGHRFIRFDSLKGNLLSYSPGSSCGSYINEKIIDSLALQPGNGFSCSNQNYNSISNTNNQIFGVMTEIKQFLHGSLTIEYVDYAKNFGIVSSCGGEPWCSGFTTLLGCRINGIVYGDTNMTDIGQINSVTPANFSLSQNFPNPFNPNTVINYSIPSNVKGETSIVKLVVYNSQGKEVITLVNEKQNPGIYEVEFNGETLPSGIYFYKLDSGDFIETKRMNLIK